MLCNDVLHACSETTLVRDVAEHTFFINQTLSVNTIVYICVISTDNLKKTDMNVTYSPLNRLSRWEVFQLLYDVLAFAEPRMEGMPIAFTNQLEKLRITFDIYDIEIAEQRRISTEQLLKADEERDFAIRKTYTLLRDYADYRYDTKKMEAATALKRIFKRYGTGSSISRRPQDTQTSMINNLLQEFARPASVEHIVTLNLTELVTALTTYNQIFTHEQRVRDKAQASYVTGVARNARINAQNDFMTFVDIVNALAIVEGEEKYIKLKQLVNQLVKEYVTKAKQRKKKKEVEE